MTRPLVGIPTWTEADDAKLRSLAIAGLISDSTKQNIDGFPGLKDVPMIGTLFRSRDFIKSETELVVMATAFTRP